MKKFKPPKNENGQVQYVPIVFKNKECLIAYINIFEFLSNSLLETMVDNGVEESLSGKILEELDFCMGSDRFNGYIRDGVNVDKLSKEEFKKLALESRKDMEESQNNSENSPTILDTEFLSVSCDCGNFISFNSPKEVPEHDYNCDICGRKLIIYTNLHDHELEYDENI